MTDGAPISLTWPPEALPEAFDALATRSGLVQGADRAAAHGAPLPTHDADALDAWIGPYARRLSLEAEQVDAPYPEAEALIRRAGPSVTPAASRSS